MLLAAQAGREFEGFACLTNIGICLVSGGDKFRIELVVVEIRVWEMAQIRHFPDAFTQILHTSKSGISATVDSFKIRSCSYFLDTSERYFSVQSAAVKICNRSVSRFLPNLGVLSEEQLLPEKGQPWIGFEFT